MMTQERLFHGLDDDPGQGRFWEMDGKHDEQPAKPFRIVLVGCGDMKLDHAAAAKDLYTSPFFKLKRKYAEQHGDAWFIVSAKYGLLHPDEVIEPYNVKLKASNVGRFRNSIQADLGYHGLYRDEWMIPGDGMKPKRLVDDIADRCELITLAGKDYRKAIQGTPLGQACLVNPVDGLDLFGQMKWLKERVTG